MTQVRKSVTIDWTFRESARAKIKVMVKRILKKHGYPPDLQEEATKTVLQQAELLCADWAEQPTPEIPGTATSTPAKSGNISPRWGSERF